MELTSMRPRFRLGIPLVFALFLGCGGGQSNPSPGGSTKPAGTTSGGVTSSSGSSAARGTIGVSLLTLENPFFKVIGDHITSEAKQHGYDTVVLSGDKDAAKQGNQVKDFIVRKVAAIVV